VATLAEDASTDAHPSWQACHQVLCTMREADMYLDAPIAQLLEQLDEMLG